MTDRGKSIEVATSPEDLPETLAQLLAKQQNALEHMLASQQAIKNELRQLLAAHQATVSECENLRNLLVAAMAEKDQLTAVNQALFRSQELELNNSLSNRIGEVMIRAVDSPSSIAGLPFKLRNFWREAKKQQQPKSLGGESFSKVLTAYADGGFDAVKALLAQASVSPAVRGNAYTALARHLKDTDPKQACDAACRAYEEDPQPFRRKWLAFRLYEAGDVLGADVLLKTLYGEKLSKSESVRMVEIRDQVNDIWEGDAHLKINALIAAKNNIQISPGEKDHGDKINTPIAHERPETVRDQPDKPDSYYLEQCRSDSVDSVICEIKTRYSEQKNTGATKLIQISKLLREGGMPEAEFPLVQAAKEICPTPAVLRAFFWAAQRARHFQEACEAIHTYEKKLRKPISDYDKERLHRMKNSPAYQLALLQLVEPKKKPTLDIIQNRICYVLHNSLPYSSGGYATRAHGVAKGLKDVGFEIIALTRPGFPLDVKPELHANDVPLSNIIEEISYFRIHHPQRKDNTLSKYIEEAARAIETKLMELKPQLVIAASNHVTGLPALIAARRLGIRFIYEVRGLWEVTRMSREEGFQESPRFAIQSLFETRVCQEADQVFTITEQLRSELISRGVNATKINILPNSCDPVRFTPREKDLRLAQHLGIPADIPIIGYIGTFVDYEGLDDLASACALLKKRNVEFRLLLVGNENASGQDRGNITEIIIRIAEDNLFANWLCMPGRIPHDEVEKYYSLIDIAPFPRKALPVCEMVSPMKPLEALAMEKPVVVSSVKALCEMITHESTGLIFEKGDIKSFANALERLIADPEFRITLGKNGRQWVIKERTWKKTAQKLAKLI